MYLGQCNLPSNQIGLLGSPINKPSLLVVGFGSLRLRLCRGMDPTLDMAMKPFLRVDTVTGSFLIVRGR